MAQRLKKYKGNNTVKIKIQKKSLSMLLKNKNIVLIIPLQQSKFPSIRIGSIKYLQDNLYPF